MICNLSGLCGNISSPNLTKKAIEEPSIAPFVQVQIRGKDDAVLAQAMNITEIYGNNPIDIGVGNGSFPAVVKSLQVGTSNGAGAEIEIVDQEGGDFSVIFERVTRLGTATDSLCWIRYGWVSTVCGGGTVAVTSAEDPRGFQPTGGSVSPWIKLVMLTFSVEYSAGTIKYKINCIDSLATLIDSKYNETIDDRFVTAVRRLCTERNVPVRFVAFNGTTEIPFRFKVDGAGTCDATLGMRRPWAGRNRTVLSCIYEWTRLHLADTGGAQGLPIRVIMDHTTGRNGTLTFLASPIDPCAGASASNANNSIANYIVNGGCDSPVISFKPVIGWTGVGANAAGGAGGGAAPGTQLNRGPAPCLANIQANPQLYTPTNGGIRLGTNLAVSANRDDILASGPLRALRYVHSHTITNNLASLAWNPITAELKVQGDPSYTHPLLYLARYMSLSVLNPFQIGTQAPCRWTNVPSCNEVLSNNSWIIEGVSHDIREGSYTTTFKLRLVAPGQDAVLDAFLGPIINAVNSVGNAIAGLPF
jgi:hypothetical protein